MHIILDTNILRRDFSLRGNDFSILLYGYKPLRGKLVVPEVVLDEIVTLYAEELNILARNTNDNLRSLARLIVSGNPPSVHNIDVPKEKEAYRSYLLDLFKKADVTVHPYPDIPHKAVVSKELSRQKPFKRNGSGYRDFLIWETVRKFGTIYGGDVVFITANTTDFGKSPELHPDLQKELSFDGAVRIFNSLSSFVETEILPQLKVLDDLKAQILDQTGTSFDVGKWVALELPDLIYNEDVGGITVGFPDNVGNVHPTHLNKLSEVKILDTRQLESGTKFVRLSVSASFNISIGIDWDDYVNNAEVRELVGTYNEPFGWLDFDFDETLTIITDLIFGQDPKKPLSEKIISLSGPNGELEFI